MLRRLAIVFVLNGIGEPSVHPAIAAWTVRKDAIASIADQNALYCSPSMLLAQVLDGVSSTRERPSVCQRQ
jgi:hypothetical protein